jgi:hypothetical protein
MGPRQKTEPDGETEKKATVPPGNKHTLPGGVRPLDFVIIALIITLTILAGLRIYGNQGNKTRLVIEGPSGHWIYPLDRDATVPIAGPLGDTVVEIKNGKARVTSSPCPNQTCVAARGISQPGEWNACLPNEVIIRVESAGGKKEVGIDAFVE